MRRNIAIDARIINSSTGTYIVKILEYLQEIDAVNQYIVLVREKDKDYWKPGVTNFSVMVAEFDNYSFAEQVGYKRFLDRLAPDLVHFCMPQQPIFYTGKSITTIHDLTLLDVYNSDKPWLVYYFKQLVGRFVFYAVAHKSIKIITPTEYVKKSVAERLKIPNDKISVTLEAAEINKNIIKPYKHPFKQFIMYVGQQSDYKNIRRLGDAHQKLLAKHPDLGLILVGRKNQSALNNEEYFTKNNYRNIHFTDFIPDEQRDWLYTHCAAYVFPSLMEGFGLPGLEAMVYGAPVVSSNTTCLPEVYADAAHYFDPKDVDDIAKKIDEVISDETLRTELIKKGYSRIKDFSWRRTAKQTHTIYMQALERK